MAVRKDPKEVQVASEDTYMEMFKSGALWRATTYGYGFPTTTERPDNLRMIRSAPLSSFKTSAPSGRHTTPRLREQVRDLREHGYSVAVISDTLNLKDARVRALIRERVTV